MKDIFVTHRDENDFGGLAYSTHHQACLLHQDLGFEATVENLQKGLVGIIYTINEGVEFSYILSGSIELKDNTHREVLKPGDSYSHRSICHYVMFRALENSEILTVSTSANYDFCQEDQQQLYDVLTKLQKVDGDTMDHCMRVKKLSLGISYFLDTFEGNLRNLLFAASFHDVGKSKIPLEILLKPGRLTEEEYNIMKMHSLYTYEMIKEFYDENVATIAYEHHEHLDGRGYPRGLAGDQISLPARIICVADAYDAMVVTRPYRQGLSKEVALKELHRCAGTQFDEKVIKALELYLDSIDNL